MPDQFHVFCGHNGADKRAVAELAQRLRNRDGIRVWLDAWRLPGGDDWRPAITAAFVQCQSFAVFFGPAHWGPNHLDEVRQAFAHREEDSGFHIIPVLLPGADITAIPNIDDDALRDKLETLFANTHRIDFRGHELKNSDLLLALATSIFGRAPGPPSINLVTIDEDAEQWAGGRRMDKALLYRGHTLQRALEVVQGHELRESVRSFLETAQSQERLRNRILIVGIATALLIAALAIFANLQRQEANRLRTIAEANADEAGKQRIAAEQNAKEANRQRKRAEDNAAEADRLGVVAEIARSKAAKGRQTLLGYLISEETQLPDELALAWASAPARRNQDATVDLAVRGEWKSIMEEVMLRPDSLRNIAVGYVALRYLSVPPVAAYDYMDREVVARSLEDPEFQRRLTANLAKAVSVLEGADRARDAVFYSPRDIPSVVSQNQFTIALANVLFTTEARSVSQVLDASHYFAHWRDSEDPSPPEFRLALAAFRKAFRDGIADLNKNLRFWQIQTPDPDLSYRRLIRAAATALRSSRATRSH